MTKYHDVEKLLGSRTYFPNSGDAAYFDPQSQTIHLTTITKAAFLKAVELEDMPSARKPLSIMMHEITHWADLVGTLWGREYLQSVFSAMKVLPETDLRGSEARYHTFVALHDRTRRLMHARYFRTENASAKPHSINQPWRFSLSAGAEFDLEGNPNSQRPILFVRFDDYSDGTPVARQPITAGALLETNAIWSEISTNFETLNSMSGIDQQIEAESFRREVVSYLYDQNFTLYTAPAHMLGFTQKISDPVRAYELASALSFLVLNFQSAHFEKLAVSDQFQDWQNFLPGFRASRDVGFAFCVLCHMAPKWVEGMTATEWLDGGLDRAGVENSQEILKSSLKEMKHGGKSDGENEFGEAEAYLLNLGIEIFTSRFSRLNPAITPMQIASEKLAVPPVFDRNGELIDLSGGRFDLSAFSLEQRHALAAKLHTWTQNFLEACR